VDWARLGVNPMFPVLRAGANLLLKRMMVYEREVPGVQWVEEEGEEHAIDI